MNITRILISIRDKYIKQYNCTPYDINNGLCVEFAEDVIKELGGYKNDVFELSTDMFFDYTGDREEDWGKVKKSEYGIWNIKMLNLYGCPDLTKFKEGLSHHNWIFYKGKHYDAETINGVDKWYKLPIFKKQLLEMNLKTKALISLLEKYSGKKVILKEDVYYEREPVPKDYTKELEEITEQLVEEQIGLVSAGYSVEKKSNKTYEIRIYAKREKRYDGKFFIHETDPQEWLDTAESLINTLAQKGYEGYRIGNYSKTNCWITNDVD